MKTNTKDAPTYQPFQLPAELEPYRNLIVNTGGNSIEELVDDYNTDRTMMRTNIVRFTLAVSVVSQIGLLQGLQREGRLA